MGDFFSQTWHVRSSYSIHVHDATLKMMLGANLFFWWFSNGHPSMVLSAPFDCVVTLSKHYHANSGAAGGNKKNNNQQYYDRRLTTLVNSTSTAPPIGLLQKMAEFCNTSNRLLVGRQCHRALLRLYFNSSTSYWMVSRLVGWSVSRSVGPSSIGWSTMKTAVLWLLEAIITVG